MHEQRNMECNIKMVIGRGDVLFIFYFFLFRFSSGPLQELIAQFDFNFLLLLPLPFRVYLRL
jgi:hypothetical protein